MFIWKKSDIGLYLINMKGNVRHILTIFFICAFFSSSIAQTFSSREASIQLVKKGDNELQFGLWHEALISYTNAIETDPEYAEAYMKRGQLNESVSRNQEAISDYNMAIRLNPVIDIYYNQRARLRILSFDYYGALEDITMAVDMNTSNSNYFKYQIDGFITLGMYEKALNNLDSINLNEKDSLYVLQRKTLIYILNNDISLAEKSANLALIINDKSYLTIDLLGLISLKQEDYEDAIVWFNQAIGLDSSQYLSYYNRGICYRFLGKNELAMDDINKSIALNNQEQNSFFKRALLKKENGDIEGSISDYDAAIALDSSYLEAIYNRSFAYKIMGDYLSAEQDIDLLIKENENRPEYWNMKGNLQVLHGDISEAILSYNFAVNYDHNYSDAYYNRGIAKLLLSQGTSACEDFQESADLGNDKAKQIMLHFCGY